jgi:DNA-binding transcriptional ArsR family regulator
LSVADPAGAVEDVERVFSALAHPSRRQILFVLHFRGGEMTAGEIAERFACSWPTTTRHLNILRNAKLVSATRRGRERVYVLERQWLGEIVGSWLHWFEESGER